MSGAADRLAAALADRYRIERELGQGGMATVYLAEDLKHKRKVALKVLKPELAAVLGAERFVQEITTTAALQHPHILPLFDSGEADGFLYYVMPFIDGETLRAKLDRETQLGIEESVRIASDVASALHYAHEHGVIHRDIKPENILLHDGRPMVADFGIALAVSAAAGGRMTETGLSLGTPHYMSPEQATAEKEITARSDVYSLGSVLYEMLTGEPPHMGTSAQQIIMKIITEDAQTVTRLRKAVPPNVAAAVAKALEKLPADRFATARGFAEALANPAFTAMATASAPASPRSAAWQRRFYLATAVAALLLVAVAVAGRKAWFGAAEEPPPIHLRLAMTPGDQIAVRPGDAYANAGRPSRTAMVFSPDGESLVFAGERAGTRQLFLRRLAGEAATPIAGTEGAESPFFSPDGKSLGFLDAGRLRRLSLDGGAPTDIAMTGRITGASWGDDDRIVVSSGSRQLVILSVTGAAPPDTILAGGAVLPQFLPGSKAILFTRVRGIATRDFQVEVVALRDRTPRVLIPDAADARFLATGHVVFARRGALMAVPFDLARLEVTGTPVVVRDDVMQSLNGTNENVLTGAAQVAISPGGHLAYLGGGITADRPARLAWADRRGNLTPVEGLGEDNYLAGRLSPDGTAIAAAVMGIRPGVQVLNLARRSSQRLAVDAFPGFPLWSLDSRRVVHVGAIRDSSSLVWSVADGSRPAEPLAEGRVQAGLPAFWSVDGSELFVLLQGKLHGLTLADGSTRTVEGLPEPVLWPTLSPDGNWLAYGANEAGRVEVFVQSWPALDRKWKVSNAGGGNPAWARQGRELSYTESTGTDSAGVPRVRLMAVDIAPGPEFSPGPPSELFAGYFATSAPLRNHDVAPDGSRFLLRYSSPVYAPPGDIHVVVNWFTELRRLMARPGGQP